MSTVLLTQNIWPELTRAVRGSRQRCAVAVAYFGAGASRLLPLRKDSCLVVDASERAVASGQTCPDDLLILVKRGVAIYSVPNLHAKVFVLGRSAFIGSTNVSARSASQLVEAVIRTSEPSAVREARQFVLKLCLHRLTPTTLKQLARLYRPPLLPGSKRSKRRAPKTFRRPSLPRLLLAQLHLGDWSESEQSLHDAGLPIARKRREHPRTFQLDSFINTGRCPYQRGDVVIQVTDEGGGNVFVAPPGNVLHTRSGREAKANKTSVFVERPVRRRRTVKTLAKSLGHGALKRLRRGGIIRDAAFAQALLNAWAEQKA
jgi:hypothetical protein